MTAGESAKAGPTPLWSLKTASQMARMARSKLDGASALLAEHGFVRTHPEEMNDFAVVLQLLDRIAALEASPPAAERTTLKDVIDKLILLEGPMNDDGTWFEEKKSIIEILKRLEAPPAAERTASADIAQAIWENDDFQDALEMIRHGIKQEQFTAYTKILQAIKSEIDASEGTKSE